MFINSATKRDDSVAMLLFGVSVMYLKMTN